MITTKFHRAPVLFALAFALGYASKTAAQSSVEVNAAGLQFNLSNPGARSLGLGGAFNASADDATAAYGNPAGLINLSDPELSIEGRGWDYANFFTDRGHQGPPTLSGIDRDRGLAEGISHNRVSGMSFLSLVYPSKGRWAAAVYRHELGAFRSGAKTVGAFYDVNSRISPSVSDLSLRIESYGAALSYRLNDTLAAGFSIARYRFKLQSQTDRFYYNANLSPVPTPGFLYGPPDYRRENIVNTQIQEGSDSAVACNAGLLWKMNPKVTLGAVYKGGSDYGMTVFSRDGPKGGSPGTVTSTADTKFHVPTTYGVGITVAYPSDDTKVSFDIDRVLYSSLTDGFVTIFGEQNRYRASDGTELHLGVQHVYQLRYPIAVRVGAWTDPDHRIRYTDPTKVQALLFRGGRADHHIAAGVGLIDLQFFTVDAAFDHSHRQDVASISMVIHWAVVQSVRGKL